MKKQKTFYIKHIISSAAVILTIALCCPVVSAQYGASGGSDRAVEIAKQSRNRVEQDSKALKNASHDLFKDFAERTVELQKLIDARDQLEKSGMLEKGDPDGEARRAHINGKILMEVGELKNVCDTHLGTLLNSLERFDNTVADSLIESQATRSINSNYELALNQYLSVEKKRFNQASEDAGKLLESYQNETDERKKERILKRYNIAKKRLLQIDQRRRLYEARVKASNINQQITGLIRQKIRDEGSEIPSKFRTLMSDLYTTFSKITPVAELGGTGSYDMLSDLGFSNVSEITQTLDVVNGAIGKLGGVLDDMVDDVLSGLGEVKIVNDGSVTTESLSMEEEMEFLQKQRESWNKG